MVNIGYQWRITQSNWLIWLWVLIVQYKNHAKKKTTNNRDFSCKIDWRNAGENARNQTEKRHKYLKLSSDQSLEISSAFKIQILRGSSPSVVFVSFVLIIIFSIMIHWQFLFCFSWEFEEITELDWAGLYISLILWQWFSI